MFFIKKKLKYIICIVFLLFVLVYVVNITSIPDTLILFENESINVSNIFGVKLEESMQVGASLNENKLDKQYNLSLFGINLKTITTNVISSTKVIPLGNLIGLKLYTKGVLVVGTSQIKGKDNKVYKPYEEADIKQGDAIVEINDEEVNTTDELIACVSKCRGEEIKVEYIREGQKIQTSLKPVKTDDNTYKIGIWVRDAVAGVGIMSFYDTQTNSIASLGHGIADIDTGEIVKISSGEITTAEIIDIQKGKEDNPGKIEGTIENSTKIGNIYSNTEFGVYSNCTNESEIDLAQNSVEVASRKEIKLGKASMICTLDNKNKEEYEVEIQKIYINNNENNKSMIIKITDERLIEKAGGIIQGMSGSPILQDGKMIGALTHVLVSDPTKRIWSICGFNDKSNENNQINYKQ